MLCYNLKTEIVSPSFFFFVAFDSVPLFSNQIETLQCWWFIAWRKKETLLQLFEKNGSPSWTYDLFALPK